MITTIGRSKLCAWLLVLLLTAPGPTLAQPSGTPAAQPGGSAAVFTPEQLEQVAAPIALYPDPLVAQVLMASTYPLEVVQAARFVKDNPSLKGDQLDEKLKDQTWDDSVKSLVFFPQVLDLMNQKLDWTQKLGDAFLAQQKDLLDAIQRLRARAQKEGNLKSTAEQKVTVEAVATPPPAQSAPAAPAPPQTVVVQQQPAQVITIEPTNPQVVYVPSYNPTVVYGAWPYPAYPPYYPYPPGYAFGAAALSFGVGMAVGAAVWGNCNWGGGNVDVDVNQNANFSRNVNRTDVASQRTQRVQQGQAGNRSQWQHNPENRRGVQYRDQASQQRYNRGQNPQAAQSREAFRGHAEQGRQDLGRGDAGRGGGAQGGGRAQTVGGGQGGGRAQTVGGGQASPGGREAGAFQGMGGGGANTRDSSNRGQTSRQSMGAGGGGGGGSRQSIGAGGGGGGGGRAAVAEVDGRAVAEEEEDAGDDQPSGRIDDARTSIGMRSRRCMAPHRYCPRGREPRGRMGGSRLGRRPAASLRVARRGREGAGGRPQERGQQGHAGDRR